MTLDPVEITRASYTRCLEAGDFLHAFYRHFFNACPPAEPLFAHTDFTKQAKLLQHAIGLLLLFPTRSLREPTVLTRLGERHGPAGLAIDPSWYPLFLESLVRTAGEFDPEFTPEIGAAWREALKPGIAYMQRFGHRVSGSTGPTAT